MGELSSTTVLVRRSGALTAEVDDELVMLDTEQSRYFGLDATGTVIWGLLAEPRTVAEVCAELVARYEVDDESCRRDVLVFAAELVDAGLVEAR
jgi:hypothetical protein